MNSRVPDKGGVCLLFHVEHFISRNAYLCIYARVASHYRKNIFPRVGGGGGRGFAQLRGFPIAPPLPFAAGVRCRGAAVQHGAGCPVVVSWGAAVQHHHGCNVRY